MATDAGSILALVVGGLLVAVIFGALIPDIANNTLGINNSESNVTGATDQLTDLVPLVIAMVTLVGIFSLVGFRVMDR